MSAAPIDLSTLGRYSAKLSISQVLAFFDRQGVVMTRTMVQNYVRVGVLPPLVNKRYYSQKHVVLLALIYSLKDTYTLDELSRIFAYLNGEWVTDTTALALYTQYVSLFTTTQTRLEALFDTTLADTSEPLTPDGHSPQAMSNMSHFLFCLLMGSVGSLAKARMSTAPPPAEEKMNGH